MTNPPVCDFEYRCKNACSDECLDCIRNWDNALTDNFETINESHESTVDEIKRYRSEYADQGNEEATK